MVKRWVSLDKLKRAFSNLADKRLDTMEEINANTTPGMLAGADALKEVNSNFGGITFAKDSSGNYGYKIGGAGSVIPFSRGGDVYAIFDNFYCTNVIAYSPSDYISKYIKKMQDNSILTYSDTTGVFTANKSCDIELKPIMYAPGGNPKFVLNKNDTPSEYTHYYSTVDVPKFHLNKGEYFKIGCINNIAYTVLLSCVILAK